MLTISSNKLWVFKIFRLSLGRSGSVRAVFHVFDWGQGGEGEGVHRVGSRGVSPIRYMTERSLSIFREFVVLSPPPLFV